MAQQGATQWLTPGSDAHIALEEEVFTPKLLKDMMSVTEFHHTGVLEIYHSMMLKYCPKRQHFSYKGMIARIQLAVLDHNHNTLRQQSVVNLGAMKGEPRYNVVFPKGQSSWVAKPITKKKSYDFLYHLIKDVKKAHTHGIQDLPSVAAPSAKNIASKPKKAVVDQHISRFKNSR